MLDGPKKYKQLYQELEDWPIYKLHEDREAFVNDIIKYTFQNLRKHYGDDLKELISKTVYSERLRIKDDPWKADPPNEINYWNKISSRLNKISSNGNGGDDDLYDDTLHQIVHRYAEEIVGGFKKKTFLFSRKFLRIFFNRLLNAAAGRNQKRIWGTQFDFDHHLQIYGPVEKIRALFDKGTVVLVPTHSSNLDSILIGYAMDILAGLPGFIYGAGLNLYDSETFSYFMNRLGAYRVDRRKRNSIYMHTLKAMSTLAIERGVNSIFFPGGTRSRSGALEEDLKKGLLSTAVEAQRKMIQAGSTKKVYIVPLVLSSHCVLEANYLIDQHLKRTGKEKYFKTKDDFNSLYNIIKFLWRLLGVDSSIVLNFGEPMDVFGNTVNEIGESINKNQVLKIDDYFSGHDGIDINDQRERIYTELLAEQISKKYASENVVLSSHAVAHAAFWYVLNKNHKLDLYETLNISPEDVTFNTSDLLETFKCVVEELKILENHKRLFLANEFENDIKALFDAGMSKLGIFHPLKPLKRNKDGEIVSESLKLLYFYYNRLLRYDMKVPLSMTKNSIV